MLSAPREITAKSLQLVQHSKADAFASKYLRQVRQLVTDVCHQLKLHCALVSKPACECQPMTKLLPAPEDGINNTFLFATLQLQDHPSGRLSQEGYQHHSEHHTHLRECMSA